MAGIVIAGSRTTLFSAAIRSAVDQFNSALYGQLEAIYEEVDEDNPILGLREVTCRIRKDPIEAGCFDTPQGCTIASWRFGDPETGEITGARVIINSEGAEALGDAFVHDVLGHKEIKSAPGTRSGDSQS